MQYQYQFDSFGNLKTRSMQELASIEDDSNAVIVLSQRTARDGRPYWAYIAVRPSRYADYMRAAKAHETVIFSDYGTVLQYGFDKEVPVAIKTMIKRRYGFDENFKDNLVRDINQAREAFLKQRDSKINDIVGKLKNKNTD
jgi:hypothetical protein